MRMFFIFLALFAFSTPALAQERGHGHRGGGHHGQRYESHGRFLSKRPNGLTIVFNLGSSRPYRGYQGDYWVERGYYYGTVSNLRPPLPTFGNYRSGNTVIVQNPPPVRYVVPATPPSNARMAGEPNCKRTYGPHAGTTYHARWDGVCDDDGR